MTNRVLKYIATISAVTLLLSVFAASMLVNKYFFYPIIPNDVYSFPIEIKSKIVYIKKIDFYILRFFYISEIISGFFILCIGIYRGFGPFCPSGKK